MNNEETKVKSFRITEDISDRIKTLCSEFDNQSAAFEALITAYEMQNAKVVLSNRQTEIEDYDVHLHALQKAFLQSLELNHNAEDRIRTEFARQLDTKDNTISDYQNRVKELEQEIKAIKNKCSEEVKDASEKLSEARKVASDAQGQISLLEADMAAVKASVRDKQSLIDTLSKQIYEAEKIKADYAAMLKETDEMKKASEKEKADLIKQLDELTKTNTSILADKEKMMAAAEIEQQKHELAIKKAITDEKSRHLNELEELRNEIEKLRAENYKLKIKKAVSSDDSDGEQLSFL